MTRADIEAASRRVAPYIRTTPVVDLGGVLSDEWALSLKLDNLQVTGSFKARGAFNLLLTTDTSSGVVAASGGNFGKAVAYAARELGVEAVVFAPETSPREKTDPIAGYGADLRLVPGYYSDALAASRVFSANTGVLLAHAYDQQAVVAGQGTVGRETEEQVPGVSSVMVAVGGGGLIGGVASWFQDASRVIAVEPERCPTFHNATNAGHPVDVDVGGIAASSLGARRIGDHGWGARHWVDQSILTDDAAIVDAQQWLWDVCRLWVEPAAATTIAALRTGAYVPDSGERVVALISGGNVTRDD